MSAKYTTANGMLDGEMMGENASTGGKFAFGLAIGALTGVIGTGIGYFVIGSAPLSYQARQRLEGKGADYHIGFQSAWDKTTRSKKRNAFLGGGVLGWLAFLAIYFA